MEPPTPTPEDEFEFLFQKAAKNKHVIHVQHADDGSPRRGSLPTAVRRIQVEDEEGNIIKSTDDNHHRASSCKSKNASKQVQYSSSTRVGSKPSISTSAKRLSQGDIGQGSSGNGFLSPLSAAGETTALSISAPQSRSGSFRSSNASPRRGSIKTENEAAGAAATAAAGVVSGDRRRSSVCLEETVAAKLRELKEIEDTNCLVVRQFTISPKGDIIHRADSFKQKREPSPKKTSPVAPIQPIQTHLQVPGQSGKPVLSRLVSCEKSHRVLVIGGRRVGKTALMTQFMTSEYLAALDTSFDTDAANEKSISVSVDGEEITLLFTDLEPDEQEEHRSLHPEVDCYLLVYSIADRKSFSYVSSLLRDLSDLKRSFAIIVVANKSDVVRKRQVPDSDAMDLCAKFSAKFIEVSAALNHKVDDLLVGIVNQIRLNPKRRQRLEAGNAAVEEPPTPTSVACSKGPFSFFTRFFSKKKVEPRPCENLQTL